MILSAKLRLAIASVVIAIGAQSSAAQDFMTQKELLATLPGATLYGVSSRDNKTRWVKTYGTGRKKGKIAGRFGDNEYTSKWSVRKNQWCEEVRDEPRCWSIVRVDDKTFQPYFEGEPTRNPWLLN